MRDSHAIFAEDADGECKKLNLTDVSRLSMSLKMDHFIHTGFHITAIMRWALHLLESLRRSRLPCTFLEVSSFFLRVVQCPVEWSTHKEPFVHALDTMSFVNCELFAHQWAYLHRLDGGTVQAHQLLCVIVFLHQVSSNTAITSPKFCNSRWPSTWKRIMWITYPLPHSLGIISLSEWAYNLAVASL